ncbi:UNVERIFIED_CONTAM: vacuolar protein sorting-associated protein 45 [Siphonaria sp. JEL0065]|nr:vacuolar protein sorting-associated protein 45 [Siphonaria sp. JEL0065]
MVQDISGMKVLLLDNETTPIISTVVTQSQLLAREVYLIDRVENKQREKMKHLKCIGFVRPSAESIQNLVEELRDPRYGDYYLCKSGHENVEDVGNSIKLDFSNTIKKSSIERLAEADETECVREVQEYYADFLAINNDIFSLSLQAPTNPLYVENSSTWDTRTFLRCAEGIISVLLALKKKPMIRYERNSQLANKLATEYQIQQEGPLFDFRKPDTPPILLIMDRRNDPVTPLLNQWTYQAMVHELFGITNGRVDLTSINDVRPELREIVLSSESDPFYKKTMFLNFGELGGNIKAYVDEYQAKHKSSMNIESINDMKKFMEDYPEFRKLSGNVTKHVTLVGELSRRVEADGLLEAGEVEQNLACSENHSQDLRTVQRLIGQSNIPFEMKLRLVLLYALRYEQSNANAIASLVESLRNCSDSTEKHISLVEGIIAYGGAERRLANIFENQDILARTKNAFKGLKGVDNVYTQHTPLLVNTLQDFIKGKAKTENYPFIEGGTKDKPQDIIIFMIGGITYAEARGIQKLNSSNTGARIILGGTTIHNSTSFLREVYDSVGRWHKSGTNISSTGQKIKTSSKKSIVDLHSRMPNILSIITAFNLATLTVYAKPPPGYHRIKSGSSIPKLVYQGGPLLKNVQVFPVYYGNDTKYQMETTSFYQSVVDSPLLDMMSQYSQPDYPIGRGSLVGSRVVTEIKQSLSDADIATLVMNLVNGGYVPTPNPNMTYIPVHFSPTVSIPGACTEYCAYHDYVSTKYGLIAFGVIPDQSTGCLGCGPGDNNRDAFLAVCDSGSHELAEAITDPQPNSGYIDSNYDEIGDLCNPTYGYLTGADGKSFLIQGEWDNSRKGCWLDYKYFNDIKIQDYNHVKNFKNFHNK